MATKSFLLIKTFKIYPVINTWLTIGLKRPSIKKSNPEKVAITKASKMSEEEKLNFIGEKSIRHYGCFGCHNIDGFDDAKPIGVEITEEGSKPVGKFDRLEELPTPAARNPMLDTLVVYTLQKQAFISPLPLAHS